MGREEKHLSEDRPDLRTYLTAAGVEIFSVGNLEKCHCPNPSHGDEDPSGVIYDDIIHCPVCPGNWDVYDTAGLLNGVTNFKEKKAAVTKALGGAPVITKKRAKKKKKPKITPHPLEVKEARKVYNKTDLMKFGYGKELTGAWLYKNDEGLVHAVDVRFETPGEKKKVITFSLDSKTKKLVTTDLPMFVYNKDLLLKHPKMKVLIVEGAKNVEAAMPLVEFDLLPISWNGGSGKAGLVDWSFLETRDVIIYPDDDDGGAKAAKVLAEATGGKVAEIVSEIRNIKSKGGDIVEELELYTHAQIASRLLGKNDKAKPKKKKQPALPPPPLLDDEDGSFPFRILGTDAKGKAYFLDRHQRVYAVNLDSINKSKMLKLAPLSFWSDGGKKLSNKDWLWRQDELIEAAGLIDYDPDVIRGRGAWREPEPDNRICFHDGKETFGEHADDRVFLRKKRLSIKLDAEDATKEELRAIFDAVKSLSLKEPIDIIRILAWSVLSRFAGACRWRTQLFLTGASSSGKSSIENYVVKPIAKPYRFNGGKTSAAGLIQDLYNDSGGVVIEEADGDTDKKKMYIEDLMSIMRQSTSDDTPKSAMGTADQSGVSYTTRCMFLFVAISSELSSVADENRLTMVRTERPKKGGKAWRDIRDGLTKAINKDVCYKLGAMMWRALPNIDELSDRIATIMQEILEVPHRYAISEGTLAAVWFTVYRLNPNPTDRVIMDYLDKHYVKVERDRDEADEMLNQILEHTLLAPFEGGTRSFSIGELFNICRTGQIVVDEEAAAAPPHTIRDFKRTISNAGVFVTKDGQLAIANNHQALKSCLRRGYGYNRTLSRHEKCVAQKNVRFVDKPRWCSVFDYDPDAEGDDEA